MNHREAGNDDGFFLRKGPAAEPRGRGEDQGYQETDEHENPASSPSAPDARSLHLTNVPDLLFFAFAYDPH
jgi:hypothetical protein